MSFDDFSKVRARTTDPLTAVAFLMSHLPDEHRQHLDDFLVALTALLLRERVVSPEQPLNPSDAMFLGEIGEDAQKILTDSESRESVVASIRELADELEKRYQWGGQ